MMRAMMETKEWEMWGCGPNRTQTTNGRRIIEVGKFLLRIETKEPDQGSFVDWSFLHEKTVFRIVGGNLPGGVLGMTVYVLG